LKTEPVIETRARPAEVGKLTVYAVAILAVLLIGYILAHAMRAYVPAPTVNAARATERAEALKGVTAVSKAELEGDAVYINKNNGIVRLPIDRAMELIVQTGTNQAAFRTNLLARAEKASAKAPEKPSEFE
jgi:hypothetical protein